MKLFTVRREQVEALAAASVETFEDNIAAHLRTVWPDETARAGDDEVLAWVRFGVRKGEPYGIETEYDVARFVDLMLLLGADFDADERIPWAREILTNEHLDGRLRVDALMDHATAMFDGMARHGEGA